VAQSDEIIGRVLAGEPAAFDELVRRWETRIFNLAWRFLGNRADAQDVVQETFLSVFQCLGQLRDPNRFATWIYRIALNHCRSRWRSRPREVSLEARQEEGDGGERPRVSEFVAQGGGNRLETIDLIRKAMAGLSDDHRSAIILKEYLGLSLEEVAAVMDCPLSTAKSRVYHGLRGVQRNLRRLI
jgi:RNA polymerase sigma-70 factor (ECF subfamily)